MAEELKFNVSEDSTMITYAAFNMYTTSVIGSIRVDECWVTRVGSIITFSKLLIKITFLRFIRLSLNMFSFKSRSKTLFVLTSTVLSILIFRSFQNETGDFGGLYTAHTKIEVDL